MHVPGMLVVGGILFGAAVWLAYRLGRQAAQIAALRQQLKQQAEEQQYAQQISRTVDAMSAASVRQRLHDISGQ